jgi:hypothetical protein
MSQRQAYFATADSEMIDRLMPLLPPGVEMRKRSAYWWHLATECCGRPNPVIGSLRSLGLLGHRAETKFIPSIYMCGSIQQRVALLQGLFDTDGSASTTKPPVFSTVSGRLASDVRELVGSLGGITHTAFGRGNVLPIFTLSVRVAEGVEPFALTRKALRYREKLQRPLRMSRAIEFVEVRGIEECRRIRVDAVDHTYLGEQFTALADATASLVCAQSKYKQTRGSCRHDLR